MVERGIIGELSYRDLQLRSTNIYPPSSLYREMISETGKLAMTITE